jgi:hypothetical protein
MFISAGERAARRTVDHQPQVVDGGVLLHLLHLDPLHLFLLRFVFSHRAVVRRNLYVIAGACRGESL